MKNSLVRFQNLVPVLDHLNSEMDSSFNSRTSLVTEVMQLLPPQIAKCADSALTPNKLTEFRAVYGDILPSPLSLDTELWPLLMG